MIKDWAFYFITDHTLTRRDVLADVSDALKGGARAVQYRAKRLEGAAMLKEAQAIRKITRDAGADLIINDRLDLALLVGADGLHLGQLDVPCKEARRFFKGIIGVSVGSLNEARKAIADGADYIAASPVWSTPTKEDAGAGLGPGFVKDLRALTTLHITAIGGVKRSNLHEVLGAGADSICAISATVATPSVAKAVTEFETAIRAFHGRGQA